jgi:hypothetical protein
MNTLGLTAHRFLMALPILLRLIWDAPIDTCPESRNLNSEGHLGNDNIILTEIFLITFKIKWKSLHDKIYKL